METTHQKVDEIGAVEFLARSASRAELLAELAEAERMDKRELRERLDASRTTIGRNLEALEDRHWIANGNGTYEITQLGELVVDDFFELLETVGTANRLTEFVRWIPEEEFDLDIRHLDDARVAFAQSDSPYAPVNRHVQTLESADRVRLLLPIVGVEPMKTLRRQLRNGARCESIVAPPLADTFRSDEQYAALIEGLRRTGDFTIEVADEPIPYYVGLVDDTVQIGVEDENGMPRALLETESEEAIEWAKRTYERYARTATPFE